MTAPHVPQQQVAAWFDATYAKKGLRYLRPVRAYPIFLQLAAATPGEHVLDVACGPGQLLAAAQQFGLRASGVDLSATAIAMANERLPGVDARVGNAEQLPFADATFDIVTCLGSLERFLDRRAALREMQRVARPGARFCFLVRNASTLVWRMWRAGLGRREVQGHQDALTLQQWRALFADCGFVVERVLPDQWPGQRWRQLLPWWRPRPGRREPIGRALLPLRWCNELVFVLRVAPRPAMNERGPQRLYDTLARWQWWRSGGGARGLELRKRLSPPPTSGDGSHDGPRDGGAGLDAWLQQRLGARPRRRVLDLGCGFGASLQRWATAGSERCVGITASRVQVDHATHSARANGLAARCTFVQGDFTAAPEGPFDVVLAIEALAHAFDLDAVLQRVLDVLSPGGTLLWLDDLRAERTSLDDADLLLVARHWRSPPLRTRAEVLAALARARLVVREEVDLTAQVPFARQAVTTSATMPVTTSLTKRCWGLRALHALAPIPAVRRIAAAFLGGVALERLYSRGAACYRLVMAERLAESS